MCQRSRVYVICVEFGSKFSMEYWLEYLQESPKARDTQADLWREEEIIRAAAEE
jgi:hypothetical protein